MRLQILVSALALLRPSLGFSDASPWILLSTSPFDGTTESKQIQTVSRALGNTRDVLKSCPTDRYLLVNQPGMTSADLRGTTTKICAIPSLCRVADDMRIQGKFIIAEVVGKVQQMNELMDTGLPRYIKDACALKEKDVVVDQLDLASLPSDDRAGALSQNDAILNERIAATTADGSFTILFLSTPGEPYYEAEFEEPVQMDLRRHVQWLNSRRKDNETDWNRLPLFEKYQFFTPGIFMGIITAIILFTILGVGIKALASLEVSYGAFEKDMGPAAQKKQ